MDGTLGNVVWWISTRSEPDLTEFANMSKRCRSNSSGLDLRAWDLPWQQSQLRGAWMSQRVSFTLWMKIRRRLVSIREHLLEVCLVEGDQHHWVSELAFSGPPPSPGQIREYGCPSVLVVSAESCPDILTSLWFCSNPFGDKVLLLTNSSFVFDLVQSLWKACFYVGCSGMFSLHCLSVCVLTLRGKSERWSKYEGNTKIPFRHVWWSRSRPSRCRCWLKNP